jgi:hypothetical protein
MCLQCVVDAKLIGNKPIFGNYFLMKSQKENEDWDKDYYGLVICNDPLLVWNIKAVKNIYFDMNSEEEIQYERENRDSCDFTFHNNLELFRDILYLDPYNGYLLIKAAIESGYDKKKHGGFECWFQHKVACFIEENEE